jgi:hypothetical protein
VGKESGESEGQKVGRRRGTYVDNVNALGNGNQHVNKLNDFNILYANLLKFCDYFHLFCH